MTSGAGCKDSRLAGPQKEARAFIGVIAYYRIFIVFLSIVAAPIFQLFQRNGKFLWSRECKDAMDEPKRRQTQSQILMALDFSHSALAIMLAVDASTTIGMRAMLSQLQFDGRARPARFEGGHLEVCGVEIPSSWNAGDW